MLESRRSFVRWKNWLFWFCLCVGLWVRAKPNVPMWGAIEFQNFLCGGKKIKTRSVRLSCWLQSSLIARSS